MRNAKPPLFRPPWAPNAAERLAAWRALQARSNPRPSKDARGYDKEWRKLRAQVLKAEPLCRQCLRRGIETPATMVDHIQSIREAPELRLDPTNLQPSCGRCHNAKTNRGERGFGLRPRG